MDLKWSELDCSNGDLRNLSTRPFILDCNSDDETLLKNKGNLNVIPYTGMYLPYDLYGHILYSGISSLK